MWQMLQRDSPRDYVVATGEASSLEQFVTVAFERLGLDWQDYVTTDPALFRPTDLAWSQGDATRAERELGWRAEYRMKRVVDEMVAAETGLGVP